MTICNTVLAHPAASDPGLAIGVHDIVMAKRHYESSIEFMLINLNHLRGIAHTTCPEIEMKPIDEWLAGILERLTKA